MTTTGCTVSSCIHKYTGEKVNQSNYRKVKYIRLIESISYLLRHHISPAIMSEESKNPKTLDRSNDAYLSANVLDLFSLKGRVVVITGGARGIGLALAFAVAEVGGEIAIIDTSNQPHEHFQLLQKLSPSVKLYV